MLIFITMNYDIVILGGGHAGGQVAISLRKEKYHGSILIISEENYLPYQRPALSKSPSNPPPPHYRAPRAQPRRSELLLSPLLPPAATAARSLHLPLTKEKLESRCATWPRWRRWARARELEAQGRAAVLRAAGRASQ